MYFSMNKRVITLLLPLILTLSVTSCENTSEIKNSCSNTFQSSEISEQNKETAQSVPDLPEIEPVSIPEGGWTEESLKSVIYINGNQIPFPCTINDLGEGFEWDVDDFSVFHEDKPSGVSIMYNGEQFAIANVDAKNESELDNSRITAIAYTYEGISLLNINGIIKGSSYDDVKKRLGGIDVEYEQGEKTTFLIQHIINDFSISILGYGDIVDTIIIKSES